MMYLYCNLKEEVAFYCFLSKNGSVICVFQGFFSFHEKLEPEIQYYCLARPIIVTHTLNV